jgi:hypothetical protein
MFLFLYLLGANLAEIDTSWCCDEVQLDEVDRTSWFDVDVANKTVRVDDLWSIVGFVANNLEICNTSSTLNISQVWLYQLSELSASELVVEFEEEELGCCSD